MFLSFTSTYSEGKALCAPDCRVSKSRLGSYLYISKVVPVLESAERFVPVTVIVPEEPVKSLILRIALSLFPLVIRIKKSLRMSSAVNHLSVSPVETTLVFVVIAVVVLNDPA